MCKLTFHLETDRNEFAIKAKNNISVFSDTSLERKAKMKNTSSDLFRNNYMGFANFKTGDIHLNLPHCLQMANFHGFSIIDMIAESIKHETLHCLIEDVDEKYSIAGSEGIIRKHFDSIQEIFEMIRMVQKINKVIIYGNKKR